MRSGQRVRNRSKNINYNNGCYFITICVDEEVDYFGRIEEEKTYLSDLGIIAYEMWYQISEHYHFVRLDEFIVMPDHIHGILFIDNTVGDRHACPLVNKNNSQLIRRQNQNLPKIIGSYKSAVSKEIHQFTFFKWQRSYYDELIHNKVEYKNIQKYIKDNPNKYIEK